MRRSSAVQGLKIWLKKRLPTSGKTILWYFKDPLLTIILCAPIEKQDKGNLGQKGLSDNMKVAFGATKDHG